MSQDKTQTLKHGPSTLSENAIHFSVSQAYSDQRNPHPTTSSQNQRECFETIQSCVGERVPFNARYTQSHETLVTGAHGQKALFSLDPSQPNPGGYTVTQFKESAEKLERTRWAQEEVREAHAAAIRNQIALDEQAARDILENWELNRRGIPPSSEFTESNKRRFDAGLVAETDDPMGQECSKRRITTEDLVLENQRGEARALAEIKRRYPIWKARKEELQRRSLAVGVVQGSSKDQSLSSNPN